MDIAFSAHLSQLTEDVSVIVRFLRGYLCHICQKSESFLAATLGINDDERLPALFDDANLEYVSENQLRYSEYGCYWERHPERKKEVKVKKLRRSSEYKTKCKDEQLIEDMKNYLIENSHMDTRVRNEVLVDGEMTRKRFLKLPYTKLLHDYHKTKVPGVSMFTLRKIYMEHFANWMSLADNTSIQNCVCPTHLQTNLFLNAINRCSNKPEIDTDTFLQTSFCENEPHRLRCLENNCYICCYSEEGFEYCKLKVAQLLELVDDDAPITYAHLNKVDRIDGDGRKYSREQIFMQESSKEEFIDLVTYYLMQGCQASGAGSKVANHFELSREDYQHSRALRNEASYTKDMVI